jgi:uroporphyrinogen-III synthase
MVEGRIDVALFTTSVQVAHLMQVAAEMGLEAELRQAFSRIVVASIGPTTSLALKEAGLPSDFEPTHPKMGILVKEAADRSPELLLRKRPPPSQP